MLEKCSCCGVVVNVNVGDEFVCTKAIRHPNMGTLVKKGTKVKVNDIVSGNTVLVGSLIMYAHFLSSNFKKVVSK